MSISDFVPQKKVDRFLRSVSSMGAGFQRSRDWKQTRRDGEVLEVNITIHPLEFAERRGMLVITHDVTDRKRLENQLLQAQKMESVGRLAGGVAHDFNNLLMAIIGFAELMEEDCDLDARGKEYLSNINLAAEKVSNLTRQLLAFARRQIIEPKAAALPLKLTTS